MSTKMEERKLTIRLTEKQYGRFARLLNHRMHQFERMEDSNTTEFIDHLLTLYEWNNDIGLAEEKIKDWVPKK